MEMLSLFLLQMVELSSLDERKYNVIIIISFLSLL